MALAILGSEIINDQRMIIDVDKVGIKTSSPTVELHVVGDGFFTGTLTVPTIVGTITTATNVIGGISSVSNLTVTSSADVSSISGTTLTYSTGKFTSLNGNIGIVTNLSGTNLNYLGIGTLGSLSIGSTEVISSNFQLKNITSLDSTTVATIESAIELAPNNFNNLNVSGISTLGYGASPGNIIVGFGSTALIVNGSANISGAITASAFYGPSGNIEDIINSITGIAVSANNVPIGTGFTTINFIGSAVSAFSGSSVANILIDPYINLDGGVPSTVYGGITSIDGGGV